MDPLALFFKGTTKTSNPWFFSSSKDGDRRRGGGGAEKNRTSLTYMTFVVVEVSNPHPTIDEQLQNRGAILQQRS